MCSFSLRYFSRDMFEVMLECWTANPEEAKTFIDRDPELFPYILSWYRDGEIFLPETVPEQAVRREMRFFGLPDDAPLQPERRSAKNDLALT